MSSNFSSAALKYFNIPKALSKRKGNGEGRENISSCHTVTQLYKKNNLVIAMKLTIFKARFLNICIGNDQKFTQKTI